MFKIHILQGGLSVGTQQKSIYKIQVRNGYWKIDKSLARFFRCIHTVMILDELIFHEMKHADPNGWFYYEADELEDACMVGEKMRVRCFKNLVDSGILELERRGIPKRNWFRINDAALENVFQQMNVPESTNVGSGDPPKEVSRDQPEAVSSINNNIINKNKNLKDRDAQRPSLSEIENLYKKYPRKEGKTKGLRIAEREVRTAQDLQDLSTAIDNYRAYTQTRVKDKAFIKHFSTFMGEWRDWLENEHGKPEPEREETEEEIRKRWGM